MQTLHCSVLWSCIIQTSRWTLYTFVVQAIPVTSTSRAVRRLFESPLGVREAARGLSQGAVRQGVCDVGCRQCISHFPCHTKAWMLHTSLRTVLMCYWKLTPNSAGFYMTRNYFIDLFLERTCNTSHCVSSSFDLALVWFPPLLVSGFIVIAYKGGQTMIICCDVL